jgi:Protein of unknown function (DUF3141)
VQETVSEQIVAGLNSWRDGAEALAERTFLTIYGNPLLQVAVGIDPADTRPQRKAAKMPLHRELVEARIAELKSRIVTGDVREGAILIGMLPGIAVGASVLTSLEPGWVKLGTYIVILPLILIQAAGW